jgi:negative regulator of flagellin synthesis FlgM
MKIVDQSDRSLLPTSGTTRASGTDAKPAGNTAAGAAAMDSESSSMVELSSTASTLLSAAAGNSDFDAEKVQRISKAISEGTYKVDPEAIADKLIANAQEVLAKPYSH